MHWDTGTIGDFHRSLECGHLFIIASYWKGGLSEGVQLDYRRHIDTFSSLHHLGHNPKFGTTGYHNLHVHSSMAKDIVKAFCTSPGNDADRRAKIQTRSPEDCTWKSDDSFTTYHCCRVRSKRLVRTSGFNDLVVKATKCSRDDGLP